MLNYAHKDGVIEPYNNIKIDNFFELQDMQLAMFRAPIVYILSHMHEDHLKGLNGGIGVGDFSPNVHWNFGPIYCSAATHRMMLLRFPHLEPFLLPCKSQEWIEICTLPPQMVPVDCQNAKVKIRLIDANHCPGAVMIHISGPLGEILHTGDFRYRGQPMLKEIGDHKFDFLYMDNTFSTPNEDFPPQPVAYQKLLTKIKEVRAADDKAKCYIYCYTLGKEEVLHNLVKDLGCRIQILKERWHRLKAIGICDEANFTLRELEKTEKISKRERKALRIADEDIEAQQKRKPYIFLRAMGGRPQTKEAVEKMKN